MRRRKRLTRVEREQHVLRAIELLPRARTLTRKNRIWKIINHHHRVLGRDPAKRMRESMKPGLR